MINIITKINTNTILINSILDFIPKLDNKLFCVDVVDVDDVVGVDVVGIVDVVVGVEAA